MVTPVSAQSAQRPCYVGIDLGGTNIKYGVVDDLGRSLGHFKMPTEVAKGPDDGAKRMGEAVHHAIAETGLRREDVASVGLGSPGTMDVPAGMLLEPHNLPGWYNFPIRERVSKHAGFPVAFINDASAAAYGEFWVGSGRDLTSMVLLTLGTGVGGGVIIDHLVIEGEHSHGGELGHVIIDYNENARRCPCGQLGHLEAYASATAVIRRMEEVLLTDRQTSLRRTQDAGEPLTPLVLAREAEAGDALSLELVHETARYLGIGIVNAAHTIDPHGVVLGGAMTFGGHANAVGRQFLDAVQAEFRRRAFPVVAAKVTIDFAQLGGDAGYIGAAGAARQAQRKSEASNL